MLEIMSPTPDEIRHSIHHNSFNSSSIKRSWIGSLKCIQSHLVSNERRLFIFFKAFLWIQKMLISAFLLPVCYIWIVLLNFRYKNVSLKFWSFLSFVKFSNIFWPLYFKYLMTVIFEYFLTLFKICNFPWYLHFKHRKCAFASATT